MTVSNIPAGICGESLFERRFLEQHAYCWVFSSRSKALLCFASQHFLPRELYLTFLSFFYPGWVEINLSV